MRISQIFAMGGDGRYDDSYYDYYYYGGCHSRYATDAGRDSLDDPRSRRTGLAAIIGSSSDGGSGLLGIGNPGR
jgi:hypothetical protein